MLKTVGMVSLGCSKNRVDSELMLGRLADAGFEITPEPRDADVIIVNTCGFIDPAKEESIDTLLEMAEYKRTGRARLLIATGCLAQRYSGELAQGLPEVDAFVGVRDFDALVEVIRRAEAGQRPVETAGRFGGCDGGRRVLTTPPYTFSTVPFFTRSSISLRIVFLDTLNFSHRVSRDTDFSCSMKVSIKSIRFVRIKISFPGSL